eukprot:SAG22_NODE_16511_length_323_cov_1.383929_1_plen_23_part_10
MQHRTSAALPLRHGPEPLLVLLS